MDTAGDARWHEIERLFHAALGRAPAERARFLEQACGADAELRREVDALLGADADADSFLESPALERIAEVPGLEPMRVGTRIGPWTTSARIASGGMGSVYRAERSDGAFEQTVAIKVIHVLADRAPLLERFQREREALSRLEHPNITRLFDGGATAEGVPYIVMEYVDGLAIDAHCDRQELDVDARLVLFEQVCAAVQYAHQRLIVHRDLKPANVLVDRFGAPKLCDFGIAKLLGDEDAARGLTLSGQQPMTLAYASPEQVRGEPVTTASDVYSLGVILYELLSGERPYAAAEDSLHKVGAAICAQEPEKPSTAAARGARAAERRPTAGKGASERLRRRLRGDLDNIVLTAMRKEPERRYASAAALAQDLQRHRQGLPVLARPDTWAYRTSKFIARHKAAAVATCALLAVVIAAGFGIARSAHIAEERLSEILRLADLSRLADASAAAERLWPALPRNVPALEQWMTDARALESRLAEHRAALETLRARATPEREAGVVVAGDGTPLVRFETAEEQWQHDKLAELVEKLAAFSAPESGAIARVGVRLEFARTVERRSIAEHAAAWQAAIAAIADVQASPAYAGLVLAPQVGLVPLGRDRDSGLQEFAHLQTGSVPARGADGVLAIGPESGIVFVLLPGGTFSMGARAPTAADAADAANVDPHARPDEGPVHAVTLAPFLLSKYEMTQGQWSRFTGTNPSVYRPGQVHGAHTIDLAHPVEQVSWEDCARELARLGLCLPTEAQWEYAARAGTTSPWSSGSERAELAPCVNLCDRTATGAGLPCAANKTWPELDDGHVVHAAVGSLRPNPFGLHDVHGNVWEWCSDGYVNYARPVREGDGARIFDDDGRRVGRGGAFTLGAESARSSHRGPGERTSRDNTIGLRAARAIDD